MMMMMMVVMGGQVKDGSAKKMSANSSRSFNRMKNKLKRHNQNYTNDIAKYRQVRPQYGNDIDK